MRHPLPHEPKPRSRLPTWHAVPPLLAAVSAAVLATVAHQIPLPRPIVLGLALLLAWLSGRLWRT